MRAGLAEVRAAVRDACGGSWRAVAAVAWASGPCDDVLAADREGPAAGVRKGCAYGTLAVVDQADPGRPVEPGNLVVAAAVAPRHSEDGGGGSWAALVARGGVVVGGDGGAPCLASAKRVTVEWSWRAGGGSCSFDAVHHRRKGCWPQSWSLNPTQAWRPQRPPFPSAPSPWARHPLVHLSRCRRRHLPQRRLPFLCRPCACTCASGRPSPCSLQRQKIVALVGKSFQFLKL